MNRESSPRIFGLKKYLNTGLWCLAFLFPILHLSAQTELSWNKTIGGDGYEELRVMHETPDGNFVFFGSHTSNATGEIDQASMGLSDYWLAKVDQSTGNIIWQNTYGGNLLDKGLAMIPTADGGFLLGGYSSTGINGTKTTSSFGNCFDCRDYWVVKTDANGNQLWDKTIRGNDKGDRMTALLETSDGSYVMAGYSRSDAAADKSESNIGGDDYWVVKLDVNGNQLWDRTLGGTGTEQAFGLVELSNGSILVGGLSFSLDDGNRTALSRGLSDYWVVNLAADGTILWDRAYGGADEDNLRDMIVANDGGIILIGESRSGASGERTQPSFGERDIWMVKIDENGNLLWERAIGASGRDQPYTVTQSSNGNLLIASISKSTAGFDRTEPALGGSDYWFVTTDANGNKIKDRVFGGDQNDNMEYALPMKNGDVILGGITATNTSAQKTEPSRGNNDVWLLKFESTLDFNLGNDTIFCIDETLNLNATITPCDCCVYTWEDGSSVADRELVVDQDTTLILSVRDGFNSLKLDTINIVATQAITVDLGADQYLCAGDSISLNAENSGENFNWFPGNETTQELLVTSADNYRVTVTDQFGCTYTDAVEIVNAPSSFSSDNPIICHGDSLFLARAWQKTSGIYVDTFTNYVGCDSIIMTDLLVAIQDTTRFFDTTCDETQAGIFSMTMDNQYFCDSTIINTVTYIAPDTTRLFANTCDEMQAGISSMTMDNQYFCDSTIISTVTYIAPDTIRLFANTCDEMQAGIFSMTMDNQYFCDSTIINTVTYIAPDTTRLFANTCDADQAGPQIATKTGFSGCDSVVITDNIFIPATFINPTIITCDVAQAGTTADTLQSQFGCDSLITTTTFNYIPADTTRLISITCDSTLVRMETETMSGFEGCDSTVIIEVQYFAPEVINVLLETCDPAQADSVTTILISEAGCDSLITITETIYRGSENTLVDLTVCDPDLVGTGTKTYDNQYGCDSTVITTTSFAAADTIYVNAVTCDPELVGNDTMLLINQNGCDSLIFTTITAEDLIVDYEINDASCYDIADGTVQVNSVMGGMEPHLFAVDDGSFQAFTLFPNLAAGPHILYVQDTDGCIAPYDFDIQAPPPLTVSLPNDTTINVGNLLTIPVNTNQAIDTIFWNETSGINCDSLSCLRPEIQPLLNSIYMVTIANGDGCSASDTMLVTVNKERPFYIPNAFSPNQDGINDQFILSPGPNATIIHSIRIYNRWGALLSESPPMMADQQVMAWNGKFKDQFVTTGIYIYLIDVSFIDGERKVLSGDVTVAR